MDAKTKREFWIMMVSMVAMTAVVAPVAFAAEIFSTVRPEVSGQSGIAAAISAPVRSENAKIGPGR
jgi:hypothetical protein